MEGGPMPIDAGLTGTAELTVTDADTAAALGSGDVPVLGTPRVLALAEAATVAALAGRLDAGRTTVGTEVRLAHTAPTPVGARVVATAHLVRVEGRRLAFEVAVTQEGRQVAVGTVERVVVHRERFLAGARRGE
ncbi:thioesterase family protein [Thermobifida alba]